MQPLLTGQLLEEVGDPIQSKEICEPCANQALGIFELAKVAMKYCLCILSYGLKARIAIQDFAFRSALILAPYLTILQDRSMDRLTKSRVLELNQHKIRCLSSLRDQVPAKLTPMPHPETRGVPHTPDSRDILRTALSL